MSAIPERASRRDSSEHPYLAWYALMHRHGSRFNEDRGVVSEKDFVLSPICSARFGINMDEDGELSLGILQEDVEAILSLRWVSGAFVRGLRGRNYVILSCFDVTEGWDAGPPGGSGVKHRVFIEVSDAYAAALVEADPQPSTLRLRAMKVSKGLPMLSKSEPRLELPFSYVVNL